MFKSVVFNLKLATDRADVFWLHGKYCATKGHFPEAKYISMGTTSDFEDAVSVGSNVIRLGESIFGKRL